MASIPLPALDVKPAAIDPTQVYKNALAIRGMNQQNQMGNIELQNVQQDQKDRQTISKLFQQNNGDLDKTVQSAAAAGVQPKTLMGLQSTSVDMKTKMAALTKDQLANFSAAHDNAAGLIQPVLDAVTPQDKDAAYQLGLKKMYANPQMYGVSDPSQIPAVRPPDDALKTQLALNMGQKEQAAQTMKQREVAAQELAANNRGGLDMAVFNSLVNDGGAPNPNGQAPNPAVAAQPQVPPANALAAGPQPQAQSVPVNPPATGATPQGVPINPPAIGTPTPVTPQAQVSQPVAAAPPVQAVVPPHGSPSVPVQPGVPAGAPPLSLQDKGQIGFDVAKGMTPEAAYAKLQQMKQDAKPDKTTSVDQQEMNAWLAKNPGKDAADYGAYKAKLVPGYNFTLQQNGAAATPAPKAADGTPLTGPDLVKTFGAKGAMVQSIVDGRQSMPQGFALKTPYWQDIMNKVYQVDPQFSEQRAQIRKAFATGPDGKNIGALNTATVHLDALGEASKALDNGSFTPGNAAYNYVSKIFGSNAPTDFDSLKSAVAGEMATAMKGNATDIEIRTIGETLNKASSPKQLSGVVNDFLHLNAQKLNTYQERYQQQIPGDTAYSPVLPSAAKVFANHGIGTGANAPSSSQSGGTAAPTQSSANKTPAPQTHSFSLSAWQQANPKGDPLAAQRAAQAQGYTVVK